MSNKYGLKTQTNDEVTNTSPFLRTQQIIFASFVAL